MKQTITINEQTNKFVWGSIDPRTGNLILYPNDIQSQIETDYQNKKPLIDIRSYNATIIFENEDNFYQVTNTGGYRHVFREEVKDGQTTIERNVEFNSKSNSWYMMPPKPISENPITHIGFIVDSSGSMHTNNLYKNVTEKGVDEFLQEQKKVKNEVLLYAMTFSNVINVLYNGENLKSIENDTLRNKFYTVEPNGTTAYYDAAMKTIEMIEEKYQDGDEVIICIMTDGYDNSSKTTIRQMSLKIKEKKSEGWNIVMIGTSDIDTERLGEDYGIGQGASIGMGTDEESTETVFRCLSQGVKRLRTGESTEIQFTTLERQQSAGVAYSSIEEAAKKAQQSNTSVLPPPKLKIPHS